MKRDVKARAERISPPPDRPIEVQIMGSDHLDILRAKDISVSGIGVKVPHRFEGCNLGSEVELIITLPDKRSFLAHGVIKHWRGSDSDHFGVQFTYIGEKNLDLIKSYIERCKKFANPHIS